MQRIIQTPRENWREKLNSQGFYFHSIDEKGNDVSHIKDKFIYWREDVAYKFTQKQQEKIKNATNQLHQMCLFVADKLVKEGNLDRLHIPKKVQYFIEESFNNKEPYLYGRFDLMYNGKDEPKMLEYNADTPTSIIESGIIQKNWQLDVHPNLSQFNTLHEALVNRWKFFKEHHNINDLHLGCFFESQEDTGNVNYLKECAEQAGINTKLFHIPNIGYDHHGNFLDSDDYIIKAIFKLFPWEMLFKEKVFRNYKNNNAMWIEPIWKAILSNKAILPILWENFPNHPNLLESNFDDNKFKKNNIDYVKKPILSREGANIDIYYNQEKILETPGIYNDSGYIYQKYIYAPEFMCYERSGWLDVWKVYPVLGSWVVGDEAVGICVREDVTRITKNTAYFVPHYIE